MKKYTIGIEPNDTLFFRSGMPFSIGEETWAETSVLPNPSVIWGALFSALLVNKSITLEEQSSLIINGIFLQRKKTAKTPSKILIPAPLDIYKKGENTFYKKEYPDAKSIISNYPTSLPYITKPNTPEIIEDVSNCFIDWLEFIENYPNESLSIRIYASEYFNATIYKVGIARSNDTRTSEEGKLYRMDMNEYKSGWEIIVEFEAPNFADTGILKIGGEGKTAKYQTISEQITEPRIKDKTDDFFKIYFHTPAFFGSGNGLLELSHLKNAKLLSASIGKPLSVGGFDIEKRQPKPMRKAIPSGTVYLFRGNPLATDLEVKALFNKEDRRKGFCIYHIIN